jgi:hypothetical protein
MVAVITAMLHGKHVHLPVAGPRLVTGFSQTSQGRVRSAYMPEQRP